MISESDTVFLSTFLPMLETIDPYNISREDRNWMNSIKVLLKSRKEKGDEILVDKLLKIWIDDIRPMKPSDCDIHIRSVNEAINFLMFFKDDNNKRFLLDLDHDAGDFRGRGGDYIKILDWIEATDYLADNPDKIIFTIHSANPVGRENMMRIIKKNDWQYI